MASRSASVDGRVEDFSVATVFQESKNLPVLVWISTTSIWG